jgi:hypothetical protein
MPDITECKKEVIYIAIGRSNCHIVSGILLRGVKTLTLVKNVSRDTLIEICCVAVLFRVVYDVVFSE